MNPTQLGFGSGSPMVGEGGEVAQQMEAGAPAMNQMGSNNPAFTPNLQQNPYPSLPAGNSILPATAPSASAGMQGAAQVQPPKTRADLIIAAFSNHLKHLQEMEKNVQNVQSGGSLYPPLQ